MSLPISKRLVKPLAAVVKGAQKADGSRDGVLSKVWARSTELTVARGKGVHVWDVQGTRYLDAAAGIAVLNTGHCHDKVVDAVQRQAGDLMHSQINNYHNEPLYELTRRLGHHLPEGLNHIYYDNTGTAGMEAAVKLARQHTKRPNLIVLHGGMHGRSGMCSAMTSNHSIRNPLYYPLPSGVFQAPFPAKFKWSCSEDAAVERALSGLHDTLRGNVRPDQVAALVFEPILGEGGFVPCPKSYYEAVREICDKYGILLVMDEIQAGYGRTGKMWGHEHMSLGNPALAPDIIVASKGIASGMPLSCVAAKKHVMDSFTPGTHGGTFNGNVVSIAAAIATLDVFEEEGIVENSKKQGATLSGMLQAVFEAHLPESDVRGPGLMIALDCVKDGAASGDAARYIKRHCQHKSNVILMSPTGVDANILRIMPPLVIQEPEVLQLADAIEHALRDFAAGVSLD